VLLVCNQIVWSRALQALRQRSAAHLRRLGAPVAEGVELCTNCRRSGAAALGAELLDSELLEPDPTSGVSALARFVGHKALVQRLVDIVKRAQAEGELQFVALTGPPGVGKSRLSRS